MSYDQYVITTFMKAGEKIIPVVVSIVVGYIVFIKLPFWFFRQTLKDVRKMHPEEDLPKFPEEPKVMRLEDKIRRDAEEMKKEQQKFKEQSRGGADRRKEQRQEQKKEGPKQEERRKEPPRRPAPEAGPSPESVFEFRPGEKFTQEQLKAKYRELLKQSHPDRVASMGPEFKKLAEKKTKELNDAYDKLKRKAS